MAFTFVEAMSLLLFVLIYIFLVIFIFMFYILVLLFVIWDYCVEIVIVIVLDRILWKEEDSCQTFTLTSHNVQGSLSRVSYPS